MTPINIRSYRSHVFLEALILLVFYWKRREASGLVYIVALPICGHRALINCMTLRQIALSASRNEES